VSVDDSALTTETGACETITITRSASGERLLPPPLLPLDRFDGVQKFRFRT
jgi:hypothetical protein